MVEIHQPSGESSGGVTSFNGLTGAIELLAGTNITLGTVGNNITINALGGGLTEIPFTGAVNSSNVTFTVSVIPTYIVADGVWFKKLDSNGNPQWSSTSLTITMINPPSQSIYGF